jgi:hypothetical protein
LILAEFWVSELMVLHSRAEARETAQSGPLSAPVANRIPGVNFDGYL